MTTSGRRLATALALTLGTLAAATPAGAQTVRAGVVSTLSGVATVARLSLREPAPLRFHDEVYVRDRITTGKDSLVRVVLGGKALITLRERTIVTIAETQETSRISVPSGRVMVGVARPLMKPGEVVEVVTPNLVAAIRGTVIVVEVTLIPEGVRSTVTVLHGQIDVTRYDTRAGGPIGPSIPVGDLQQVVVVNDGPIPAPNTLTAEAAHDIADGYVVAPARAQHSISTTDAIIDRSLQDAARLLSQTGDANIRSGQTLQAGSVGFAAPGAVAGALGGGGSAVGGAVGGALGGGGGAVGGAVGGAPGGNGLVVPRVLPNLLH